MNQITTVNDLYTMKVNESRRLILPFDRATVLRVPGGWIYWLDSAKMGCYVPFVYHPALEDT